MTTPDIHSLVPRKHTAFENFTKSLTLEDINGLAKREFLLFTSEAKKALKVKGITWVMLFQYIEEAEGQDGYPYWLQFETTDAVVSDIVAYFAAIQEP
jgi:hypothetical protein